MTIKFKILGTALIAASASWLAAPASAQYYGYGNWAPGYYSYSDGWIRTAPADTVPYRARRAPAAIARSRVDDAYASFGYAGPATRSFGAVGTPAPAPFYGYSGGYGAPCSDVGDANTATPSWACPPAPR